MGFNSAFKGLIAVGLQAPCILSYDRIGQLMHTAPWQPTRFSLHPPDGQLNLSGGLKKGKYLPLLKTAPRHENVQRSGFIAPRSYMEIRGQLRHGGFTQTESVTRYSCPCGARIWFVQTAV